MDDVLTLMSHFSLEENVTPSNPREDVEIPERL